MGQNEVVEASAPNFIRTNTTDGGVKRLYVARHTGANFDGTRMRKAIQRKTVDSIGTEAKYVENRLYRLRGRCMLQADVNYATNLFSVHESVGNASTLAATKYVHTSINKENCPIFTVKWTPGGKRLVTGTYRGEFTVWNGLNFNFETILQAHNDAVRGMVWTHSQEYMLSADSKGVVKYWQANMNNIRTVKAHAETIRDLCLSPNDTKFATGSDDRTVKIFDFRTGVEESELAGDQGDQGHGWDIKSIDWHPSFSLIATASKDKQIKLWDPHANRLITTIHAHKNAVIAVKFNNNGNWFMSASRDQLIKLYDIRTMREILTFKGHESDVCAAAWHPVNPNVLVSGDKTGDIHFWSTANESPMASIYKAHESNVWALDWHPTGHLLASGSNDYTTKFWTRNYPTPNTITTNTIPPPLPPPPPIMTNNLNRFQQQLPAFHSFALPPPPPFQNR